MLNRIRIEDLVPGKERWISYNDRKSHALSETLLAEIMEEATLNLWSDNPIHGRLLGQKLFDLLNGSGGLLHGVRTAQEEKGASGTLALQLPKDLMNLPFEIMWDGASFITLSGHTPIIRQVSTKNRFKKSPLENRPISMLFMACSPQDSKPVLDFEAEEEAIVRQLEDEKLPVDVRVEDSGSLEGVKFALREFGPFDIVHLTGHARMTTSGPIFQMESETGFLVKVSPEELWATMRNRAPRILFLSGCETGKTAGHAAGSFAQIMIQQGVPFAIGWGLPVYDRGATLFARSLYRGLGEGLALDVAVNQARQDLATDYHTASLLRVFCDGTAMGPLTNPKERVVRRPIRTERYRHLAKSQVKVLDYGFVGRRRQVQKGIRVLKGDLPDKNGLLLTGAAGVGKSTLAGKLVERFPDRFLVVWSGEVTPHGGHQSFGHTFRSEAAKGSDRYSA